ncbi:MAG: YgiQ family radical SAM protein [Polyangiaceae bacterium]|nr:YgiQ family radical SAM protein [Polyangiaceae bacterium]MCE7888142.1 YgiQ family radical SAM protein [Sorangiineae bacterium PRO1]MCL4750941.1 YgiQ family radical SAM protein [Myxococcales bacterium]
MSLVPLRRHRSAPSPSELRAFLPTSRAEMDARGWEELDILIVTGDAYVDHPAFGPVLIARFLEGRGYRVGLLAQPRWDGPEALRVMGRPRLFVGVSAGNLDSMLNKLTAQKKVRSDDQYSPGGRPNQRPNRASIVYANLCRQAFPGLPVVLGGIEASLRRIAHYDYWSDSVRRSVLLDAKADLLVFGMGERAAWEIAQRLAAGERASDLHDVRGTAVVKKNPAEWQPLADAPSRFVTDGKLVVLPSFDDVSRDKRAFAKMTALFQKETNAHNGRPLLQVHGQEAVYLNPPALPLAEADMDGLYALPFARRPHFSYGQERIPAFETVKHSIVTMRGCFGGCTFCSITEHEGRIIQSRSERSVLDEIRQLSRMSGFSGVVTDVGGPTANMYKLHCKEPKIEAACRRLSCVHPGVCENLVTDHDPLVQLLRKVRREKGVKRVFIASGVRYDLAVKSPAFIRELAEHHTGGQLSVAPEHVDPEVLDKMKKPGVETYERFAQAFCQASDAAGKEQYLVPYYITGHPGSTLADTIELARYLKRNDMRPRQVQDFIPTPMAVATAMYFTGLDPFTGEPVPVARELRDKRLLKALIFWWDPEHWPLAREALRKAGRSDLIGTRDSALIPPARPAREGPPKGGWYKGGRVERGPRTASHGRAQDAQGGGGRAERGDAPREGAAPPRAGRRQR